MPFFRFASTLVLASTLCILLNLPVWAESSDIPDWLNKIQQGVSLVQSGKYPEAETLFLQVLEEGKLENDEGKKTVLLAFASGNLGQLYTEMGRFKDAQMYLGLSLYACEKIYKPDSPDIALILNNLGISYKDNGEYEYAEPYFKRALAIYEKSGGEGYARCLNNYAENFRLQEKYAEAEPLYKKALEVRKAIGMDVNSSIPLANLATLYMAQGKLNEAELLLNQSITLQEKYLGADHPYLATNYNSLGLLYARKKRDDEALKLYLKAFEIHKKALGSVHPLIALDLNQIGVQYANMGQFDKAEESLLGAFSIYKKSVKPDHHGYQAVKRNLIAVYQSTNRMDAAAKLESEP